MIVCIIQARMGSTRLPGKILKNLAGRPMLWHVAERVKRAKLVDAAVVATTTESEDDQVKSFCEAHGIAHFRGSAENVLGRYYEAARQFDADVVVRVTGDCPLIDPEVIDECIRAFRTHRPDYISNVNPGPRSFPRGLDVEVFAFTALEDAFQNAREPYEREHVTPFMWENKDGHFRLGPPVLASAEYASSRRLTVDYPEDFTLMEKIYTILYQEGGIVHVPDALRLLDENPEIAAINAHCAQKPMK